MNVELEIKNNELEIRKFGEVMGGLLSVKH
jgi:hypothetical protein